MSSLTSSICSPTSFIESEFDTITNSTIDEGINSSEEKFDNEQYQHSLKDIRKIKNELHCLKKVSKWYRGELKIQKSMRKKALEKLYLNERKFLKKNKSLELECQRLSVLYNETKINSLKDKELLLKSLIENRDIEKKNLKEDVSQQIAEYEIQKLKKIIEEHQTIIDLLRKQKQNLLLELFNVSSEKDSKILVLEKENFMLVEKCKNLFIANRKLKEITITDTCRPRIDSGDIEENCLKANTKDENRNINHSNEVKNHEIKRKTLVVKLNKTACNESKSTQGFFNFEKYGIPNNFLNTENCSQIHPDLQYPKLLTLAKEYIIDVQNSDNKINENCEVQQKMEYANGDYMSFLNDLEKLIIALKKIENIFSKNNNISNNDRNSLKVPDTNSSISYNNQSSIEEVLTICFNVVMNLKIKFDYFKNEYEATKTKNHGLESLIKDLNLIFDPNIYLIKIAYFQIPNDNLQKVRLSCDVQETIEKNDLLNKLFLKIVNKSLAKNISIERLKDYLKHINLFSYRKYEDSSNLSFELEENYIKSIDYSKSHEALKFIRNLSENKNQDKNDNRKTKNKFSIKRTNKHGTKFYQQKLNKLRFQLENVTLRKIIYDRKLNENAKMNSIINFNAIILIRNYHTRMIESKPNYDKIDKLINQSNTFVPSLSNIYKNVENIKRDVNVLLNKSNSLNTVPMGSLRKQRMLLSSNINEQYKSLMDELQEIS